MKKPKIPSPKSADMLQLRFDTAVKERLEILSGERSTPLVKLAPTASTAEIIVTLNALIDLLQ